MTLTRRAALAVTGLMAAPALVHAAEQPIRWRMTTSWPRNLPGPGVSARRLAERINAMSGGRLVVQVFAAGEIVPAFGAFDAVTNHVVEMAHTAAFFWQGKLPGAVYFTTVPFGLGPIEHQAWIESGGGQALWDETYAPFGIRPFLAGNTGPSMGGWFKRAINSPDDLKGLRIRVQGLGGFVFQKLGATALAIAPGDVYPSLERGVLDAAEFLAPVNDLALGLQAIAPIYYAPGFNKPNGAAEALVSDKAWKALPDDLKAIVESACRAEHAQGLADAQAQNATALAQLTSRGARVLLFPDSVMKAAREAADSVLAELAAKDELTGRIASSYRAAIDTGRIWNTLSADMSRRIRSF
jgi:TRAP-type mannitol/chloroaromatic compound transport system substrate-binding protein